MICESVISAKRRRWVVVEADAAAVDRLMSGLAVSRLAAVCLVNRGIHTVDAGRAFLEPKFKELHSPWLLPGMQSAADRIAAAVRNREKITLYGDYDVDGITGTAMLWHTLSAAGANVETYIPHRVDEGYGLNTEAVISLIEGGTKLLVTVDCGCSAVAPIAAARQRGVDVIVSDHHEFPADGALPDATAIVHPRLPGAPTYPNGDLCGAGVAFKLAWAVAQKLSGAEKVTEAYRALLIEFSALTALGTIADVMPLVGENRIIVTYGLRQLSRTRIEGLRALMDAAGYGEDRKPDCMAVGFGLAPRLNAAGRMGHAREALELLTTATGPRAVEIANWLEAQNRTRQATERKMAEIARSQILERRSLAVSEEVVLVAVDKGFHAGVVGIVASRLVDAFHRPAFVLSESDAGLHGSARSIPGFELHLAIDHVRDVLLSGGGHAMAGGVKLAAERLDEFRDRLNAYARTLLTDDLLVPVTQVDGELTLADCKPALIGELDRLEPYGRGNPRPRFVVRGLKLSAPPRRVGATGSHLQLTVSQNRDIVRCIAFKMGSLEPQLPVGLDLDLVVEPKIEEWNGRARVDLVVVDLARCDAQPFTVSDE